MTFAKPPYKSNGHYLTRQLFQEQAWKNNNPKVVVDNSIVAPFCLYGPKEGYIDFGKHYVESEDPTGYTTAKELLGDWHHWEFLMKRPWFREAKEYWDRELKVRLESKAVDQIKEHALGGDAKALTASKYIHQLAQAVGQKKQRGRPSKEEIEGNLKQETKDLSEILSDAERIKLVKK